MPNPTSPPPHSQALPCPAVAPLVVDPPPTSHALTVHERNPDFYRDAQTDKQKNKRKRPPVPAFTPQSPAVMLRMRRNTVDKAGDPSATSQNKESVQSTHVGADEDTNEVQAVATTEVGVAPKKKRRSLGIVSSLMKKPQRASARSCTGSDENQLEEEEEGYITVTPEKSDYISTEQQVCSSNHPVGCCRDDSEDKERSQLVGQAEENAADAMDSSEADEDEVEGDLKHELITPETVELTAADYASIAQAPVGLSLFEFTARVPDELSFLPFQRLRKLEESDDGWFLMLDGKVAIHTLQESGGPLCVRVGSQLGWVPENYITFDEAEMQACARHQEQQEQQPGDSAQSKARKAEPETSCERETMREAPKDLEEGSLVEDCVTHFSTPLQEMSQELLQEVQGLAVSPIVSKERSAGDSPTLTPASSPRRASSPKRMVPRRRRSSAARSPNHACKRATTSVADAIVRLPTDEDAVCACRNGASTCKAVPLARVKLDSKEELETNEEEDQVARDGVVRTTPPTRPVPVAAPRSAASRIVTRALPPCESDVVVEDGPTRANEPVASLQTDMTRPAIKPRCPRAKNPPHAEEAATPLPPSMPQKPDGASAALQQEQQQPPSPAARHLSQNAPPPRVARTTKPLSPAPEPPVFAQKRGEEGKDGKQQNGGGKERSRGGHTNHVRTYHVHYPAPPPPVLNRGISVRNTSGGLEEGVFARRLSIRKGGKRSERVVLRGKKKKKKPMKDEEESNKKKNKKNEMGQQKQKTKPAKQTKLAKRISAEMSKSALAEAPRDRRKKRLTPVDISVPTLVAMSPSPARLSVPVIAQSQEMPTSSNNTIITHHSVEAAEHAQETMKLQPLRRHSKPVSGGYDSSPNASPNVSHNSDNDSAATLSSPHQHARKGRRRSSKKQAPIPARVLFDFSGNHADEMCICAGEMVTVVDVCPDYDGWYYGRVGKEKRGYFPSQYVEMAAPVAHAKPPHAGLQNGYQGSPDGKRDEQASTATGHVAPAHAHAAISPPKRRSTAL